MRKRDKESKKEGKRAAASETDGTGPRTNVEWCGCDSNSSSSTDSIATVGKGKSVPQEEESIARPIEYVRPVVTSSSMSLSHCH